MKYTATDNMTLLNVLQGLSKTASKNTLRSWINDGRVLVDGTIATRADQMVAKGQNILVTPRRKKLSGGLSVLYEDEHIIAVDKRHGLLSVATPFEKQLTAHGILKEYFRPRKVEVVHRIDQDTSGVMIFALSFKAKEELKKMFEAHDLERLYVAIVQGVVESEKGTWQSQLVEDSRYMVHSTDDLKVGRHAITHYRCLNSNKRFSWLELTLETGRKNQIRVHCRDAGHPIVGDKKYGASSSPLKRLCLHSYRIAFKHPVTGKKMVFESPVPASFFTLIEPGKSYA